jgi:flagellar hook-associated protein 2
MAGLTAAGIGSGLDVNGLVTQLMSVERRGLGTIQRAQSGIQTKLSAYGTITSSMNGLADAARRLTQTNTVTALTASTSNKEMVTATTDSTAVPGSSTLNVSQLAQVQRLVGPRVSDVTAAIGTGRITIEVGSYNSGDNSFTSKADTTPVSIEIGEGQNTLEGIRDAINNASAGATASLVNDGSGFRLVITSSSSGSSNSLKITVDDNDGNDNNDETGGATPTATSFAAGNLGGLSFLAFDPTASGEGSGKNLQQIQAAQSAQFTIDGISITSETNTVSGAVKGVTFNLNQVTTSPVRIDIKQDTTLVTNAVGAFVNAFNATNNVLKQQSSAEGDLSRETMPTAIQRQLRAALRGTLSAYNLSISDVGMSFDKDGVLSLNTTKFNEALTKDPSIARKLFADTGSTSDARINYVTATTDTIPGTYAVNVSTSSDGSTTAAGTINGAAARASGNLLTGPDGNDAKGLVVRAINGYTGDLGTVTFTRGFASNLLKTITTLTDNTNGTLTTRTSTLNKQMRQLDDRTERENLRLGELEKRYRQQYSALDSQLSKFQSTSNYISQNLVSR